MNSVERGKDPWHMLRFGDKKQGLALIRENHEREQTPSHIMELGNAYLWIADYEAAKDHFSKAIRKFPLSMSSFYEMLGVARWCLAEYGGAVNDWSKGLRAQYADCAGLGISLPLLLFAASILRPSAFPKKEAEESLTRKIADPRSRHWPGTLAGFVLGGTSFEEAIDLTASTKEFDRKHREWKVEFYKSVLEFETHRVSRDQLSRSMGMATDTTHPLFSDQHYFLSLMWSAEFFIARELALGVP